MVSLKKLRDNVINTDPKGTGYAPRLLSVSFTKEFLDDLNNGELYMTCLGFDKPKFHVVMHPCASCVIPFGLEFKVVRKEWDEKVIILPKSDYFISKNLLFLGYKLENNQEISISVFNPTAGDITICDGDIIAEMMVLKLSSSIHME